MKVAVELMFDNYQSGDPSSLCFKREGGGWLSKEELQSRVIDHLEKIIDIMPDGNTLKISIISE